jgi:hypothetical protein
VDALTFIDELVGLLAWPAAVVAVAWAARGPLLALASRHRPPPAAPSGTDDEVGTGDDAGAAAAKHDGSPSPDGDSRADQAALLGASLAVVLTQFFGAGSWGWWSTGIGLTLLLVVLGYFRISTDPRLGRLRWFVRLLGFAAVIGLCSTVALAYGVQTLQSGWTAPGTSGRSVRAFCENLGWGPPPRRSMRPTRSSRKTRIATCFTTSGRRPRSRLKRTVSGSTAARTSGGSAWAPP